MISPLTPMRSVPNASCLCLACPCGCVRGRYGSASGFTECYNLLHKHVDHVFDAIHAAQRNTKQ